MSSPLDDEPLVEGRIFRSDVSARRWIIAGVLVVIGLYAGVTYVSWLLINAT